MIDGLNKATKRHIVAVFVILLMSGCITAPSEKDMKTKKDLNDESDTFIFAKPVQSTERNISLIQNGTEFLQEHEELQSMVLAAPESGVNREVRSEVTEKIEQQLKDEYNIQSGDFYLKYKSQTYYIRLSEEE